MSMIQGSGGAFQQASFQLDHLKAKAEQLQDNLKKKDVKDEALYKACEDFESIFTQLVFKEMRKTVDKTELTDGGFAEEIFQGMMDEEVAKAAAKRNGTIADILYQQLRLQLDGKS